MRDRPATRAPRRSRTGGRSSADANADHGSGGAPGGRVLGRKLMLVPPAAGCTLAQEGDVGRLTLRTARSLHAHRGARGPDDGHHQIGLDLAVTEILMTVPARVERILGIVRVNEVDASGDGLDP